MARRRKGVMSEELKYELAKDLGFYDTVQKEGWGGIRAKDAGNMVKRALQIAEKTLAEQARQGGGTAVAARPAAQPTAFASTANARPAGVMPQAAPARPMPVFAGVQGGGTGAPAAGRYRS